VTGTSPRRRRKGITQVAIVAKISEGRADRLEQMDLARKRTLAVRQVLEKSNGIPLGTMRGSRFLRAADRVV
jgi:hypothetical protein